MLQCISWNLHYYVEFFISFRSAKCQNLVSVNNTYVLGIVPRLKSKTVQFSEVMSQKSLKKLTCNFQQRKMRLLRMTWTYFDVIKLTNMQQIFVALFFHFWSTMLCFEKFMVYNSDGLGSEKTGPGWT